MFCFQTLAFQLARRPHHIHQRCTKAQNTEQDQHPGLGTQPIIQRKPDPDPDGDCRHNLNRYAQANGRTRHRSGASPRPKLRIPPFPRAGKAFIEVGRGRRVGHCECLACFATKAPEADCPQIPTPKRRSGVRRADHRRGKGQGSMRPTPRCAHLPQLRQATPASLARATTSNAQPWRQIRPRTWPVIALLPAAGRLWSTNAG